MKIINWELERGQIILYSVKKIEVISLTALEYKAFKKLKNGKLQRTQDLLRTMYDYKTKLDRDNTNLKGLIWRLNTKIKPIGHIDSRYKWGYIFNAKIGERKDGEK